MTSKPPSDESDHELVQRLNEGDCTAFDVLYWRYRDWVSRLAWRFTGHQEDTQDVLQETFAYFARKFPGFHLTAALTTFFYPAVRNLSIAARKKRHRMTGTEVDFELFESSAAAASETSEFASILSPLSATHREILLMRFVDDMTQPEIAFALDLPLGTVKSRLHHAIQSVKQLPNISRLLSTEGA